MASITILINIIISKNSSKITTVLNFNFYYRLCKFIIILNYSMVIFNLL